jgi:hypothetical protein
LPPSTITLTNVVFLAGIVAVIVPKSKQEGGEENPFLPPPVDLDQIPLADKYRLITNTKCDFYFADLQSWLKEVFLDQSDEIGLWESNLPLYLFPQIHPFLEFTPQCKPPAYHNLSVAEEIYRFFVDHPARQGRTKAENL